MAQKKLDYSNPLLRDYSEEETTKRKPGRPRKDTIIRNIEGGNSTQEGLEADSMRFSAICKVQNIKDLKDYAYTKRIPIRDALDEILEDFFTTYKSNPKNEKLLDHTRKGRK